MTARLPLDVFAAGTRTLLLLTVAADVLLFAGGIPLERYSLLAAADKSSSVVSIALLLLANLALLAVASVAIAASSCLIHRLIKVVVHERLRR